MKQFDFASAHRELVAPAYAALPEDLRALYLATVEATEAESLHQGSDLDTRWPDAGGPFAGLRARFEAADLDTLALAAAVIHDAGHWHPGKGAALDLPGRASGAHWKFSNYADQVLRARYQLRRDGPEAGVGVRIIDGEVRVCYASRDSWNWQVYGVATAANMAGAREAAARVTRAYSTIPARNRHERDNAAYEAMQTLGGPGPCFNIEPYMVDESELVTPDAERITGQTTTAAACADAVLKIRAEFDRKRAKLTAEQERLEWFAARGLITENVIYYDHTDTVTIGWRHALTDKAIGMWLDIMAEYPYKYEIKGYDAYRNRQNAATTGTPAEALTRP